MSLVINHNLMALNAANNLGTIYGRLATSTQRLSSGLRINSAADDAAGLAVRELMRADIAVLNQGVRNAGDAISMIQTAEGSLSVIDEKLTRMKELAEQASTGTYTTAQRAIMDGEYQAMAAEIDRIANATNFNGVRLLNGTVNALHGGSGLKVHFGTGNSSAEDYYYIKIDDMRATSATGLRVGGGGTEDVWAASAGYADTTSPQISGGYFAYYYDVSGAYSGGSYAANDLAGFYQLASGGLYGLSDVLAQVNLGTAGRIFATTASNATASFTSGTALFTINGQTVMVADLSAAKFGASFIVVGQSDISAASSPYILQSLVISLFNNASFATVWATSGSGSGSIMFVAKTPGVDGNNYSAIDTASAIFGFDGITSNSATFLSGGGVAWAAASSVLNSTDNLYHLQLTGEDRLDNHDITVVTPSSIVTNLGSLDGGNYVAAAFQETTDATSSPWDGGDILTQSHAQLALAQIDAAINIKDSGRATLGAYQNRLENTITNLTIQAENLTASESRISDVDVATEMTEFTKNQILAQAATAMLAQANSVSQMALTLLGGV
jgi:flagellin